MRPPGPFALGSRRRGPPRSARIRDAGPATGAKADPPLRLWLPREEPSFSIPRLPCPFPGIVCRRKRLLNQLRPPRRSPAPRPRHRLQDGARGWRPRAFPSASPPEGVRARVRSGAPARGREWAAPTRERAPPRAAGGFRLQVPGASAAFLPET